MTPPDPNAATRAYLTDYLNRPDPGFAVLLAAPWGAGKTHLVKHVIAERKGEKPLLVSLFGVRSADDIYDAIGRALFGENAKTGEGALEAARQACRTR
ncbi:MAG: P-loop NTPase fold protein [Rhodobacteraceae bacterium]|nr:P-loop NTPase fold protein [Paracoccaceae bacterium]